MRTQPAISVLMPVYNAAGTVGTAIDSILGQTDSGFEFIIVDDGSADTSRDVIRRKAREDDRIRPFFRPHQGIVAALNHGLDRARGSYIARMDADDISHPTRLGKQRRHLDAVPDVGLVSCLVDHLGDKQTHAGYARYVSWINSLTDPEQIALNRFIESPLAHPSVMFRKGVAEHFGAYQSGDFPEDYELWLRWLQNDVRMEKIPEVLLQWRDSPDRLSRTDRRYSFEAFYRTKARYMARWLQQFNPHHPEVVIWGAGRTSRKRAEMLTQHGIHITRYIDVDPNKIGQSIHGRPVWGPGDVPDAGMCFIISYVGIHDVRQQIVSHLTDRGYTAGTDFIFAA